MTFDIDKFISENEKLCEAPAWQSVAEKTKALVLSNKLLKKYREALLNLDGMFLEDADLVDEALAYDPTKEGVDSAT